MRIYLTPTAASSRLDPDLAYTSTLALEETLTKDGFEVIRNLPTSKENTFKQYVGVMQNDSVSILISCKEAKAGQKPKPIVTLSTSTFDTSKLPEITFQQLEFWLPDPPQWIIQSNVSDYSMIKREITPIVIHLGTYRTVKDLKQIIQSKSRVLNALHRSLDQYRDAKEYSHDTRIQRSNC